MVSAPPKHSLLVSEIFSSIQGEGKFTGIPCTFIRLTGCNLRCTWCDTQYAYHDGELMDPAQILDKVINLGMPVVEITGGEPLIQEGVYDLFEKLHLQGRNVLLETNGSCSLAKVPDYVHIIMDIKPPSSNGFTEASLANLSFLKSSDEIKFVISSLEDFQWADNLIKGILLKHRLPASIIMQPAFGLIEGRKLSDWILESGQQYRLGFQLHKYIFGAEERGV